MAPLILPSHSDLSRQRLESTLANELYSPSFTSAPSPTSYVDEEESLEYVRGADVMAASKHYNHAEHSANSSYHTREQSMFVDTSLASTAGHHASAVTLGAGVFSQGKGQSYPDTSGEFDPERSLGRLVNELDKVMGTDRLPERPTSPFSPVRSPTPIGSNPLNFSFIFTRNSPLPSPPQSDHGDEQTPKPRTKKTAANRQQQSLKEPPDEDTLSNLALPVLSRRNHKLEKDGVHGIRAETSRSRSVSAPAQNPKTPGNITGMTSLMQSPAQAAKFGHLDPDESVGGKVAMDIPKALGKLNERLKCLEIENSTSRRRVKELEDEVARAKEEVVEAGRIGEKEFQDAKSEKTALENLVASTREHLARLTLELGQQKDLVVKLQSSKLDILSNSAELAEIRDKIARLSRQVSTVNAIVEQGLEARKQARGERTLKMEREEMMKIVRQVMADGCNNYDKDEGTKHGKGPPKPSKLRQGLQTAASNFDTLAPSTIEKTTRKYSPSENLTCSPTPTAQAPSRQSSRALVNHKKPLASTVKTISPDINVDQLEKEFFSMTAEEFKKSQEPEKKDDEKDKKNRLQRVVGELEDDYNRHRRVYTELSDRYKRLDPAADPQKRRALAQRLRDVITILEKKAHQISDLRSLL
ncbi:hypothetical protein L204_103381 [Cryptococcus depauperatus]|nr:hypothetical protein L204_01699 [Cryptococcus depauperatus CBS 7855]